MILIELLYQAVKSQSNSDVTGWVDDNDFNAFIRNAELALIEFLTGKVNEAPAPFVSKNVDWLIPFIKSKKGNFKDDFALPDDYYHYNHLKLKTAPDTWGTVEIMTPPQAQERAESHIEEVRDIFTGFIVDKGIEMANPGIQSEYKLTYYRYPVFGVYGSSAENEWNEPRYDEATSVNLEWPQIAEPYFLFKINEYINKRNREIVAAQMNTP